MAALRPGFIVESVMFETSVICKVKRSLIEGIVLGVDGCNSAENIAACSREFVEVLLMLAERTYSPHEEGHFAISVIPDSATNDGIYLLLDDEVVARDMDGCTKFYNDLLSSAITKRINDFLSYVEYAADDSGNCSIPQQIDAINFAFSLVTQELRDRAFALRSNYANAVKAVEYLCTHGKTISRDDPMFRGNRLQPRLQGA